MNRLQCTVSVFVITALAAMAIGSTPEATVPSAPPLDRVDAAQLHLAALSAATASGPVEAIAAGTSKILEAVVMEVRGRCQWRTDSSSPWKKATIDDRLAPGSMIRTGLSSHLALRCGPNATVLVDSNSRVTVPNLAQNGDTLSTVVQVSRGRADFKVDRVGLTNDFSVVTPSGALSVRGTGMGVGYDGFSGTSVHGARYNSINAIEMRYYGSKKVFNVSGAGTTSNRGKNPTHKAVGKTLAKSSLVRSETVDAKTQTGNIPQRMDSMQQTTRLVLAAEQGDRERGRIRDFDAQIREELAAAVPPVEPAPPPLPPIEDLPPVQELLDLPEVVLNPIEMAGFQAYFESVVSPTDRGMLAAAILFDLAPSSDLMPTITPNVNFDPNNSASPAVFFRRQIPTLFEPAVYEAMTAAGLSPEALGVRFVSDPNNPGKGLVAGAELPFGIYNPAIPISNIGEMYATINAYGDVRRLNGWLNGTGDPGPRDYDLDRILKSVDQFASITQVNPIQIRAAFSGAVQHTLYTPSDSSAGFTNYGQSLLTEYLYSIPGIEP